MKSHTTKSPAKSPNNNQKAKEKSPEKEDDEKNTGSRSYQEHASINYAQSDPTFDAVKGGIKSVPFLDAGVQFFWEAVLKNIIPEDGSQKEEFVYNLPNYSNSNNPLWTFLELGESEQFGNLCKSDNQYYNGMVVDFCIFSSSEPKNKPPEIVQKSLEFFKSIFDNENHDCIEEVFQSNCHVIVHTKDNSNESVVISAVVFAIMPCGLWINFLASKSAKFLKKLYSNGDDSSFDRRGLGLFMIKQVHHFAVQLKQKLLINCSSIYLKTPEKVSEDEEKKRVARFYKKIGFHKETTIPQDLLKFCKEKRGQGVDFQLNDEDQDGAKGSELLILSSEPWRRYTTKLLPPNVRLDDRAVAKAVISTASKARSTRSRTNVTSINDKTEEIKQYLTLERTVAKDKVNKTYYRLSEYGEMLQDVFGYGIKDKEPLHKPPFGMSSIKESTNQDGDNIIFPDLIINYQPTNSHKFEHNIKIYVTWNFGMPKSLLPPVILNLI